MWSHDSHVTNSGACVGHWYTLRCSDLHWDMHLYGLTTCLCLLFLLSALLTCVVCAHALLVPTSVSPPRCVHVCLSVVATTVSSPFPSPSSACHTLPLPLTVCPIVELCQQGLTVHSSMLEMSPG